MCVFKSIGQQIFLDIYHIHTHKNVSNLIGKMSDIVTLTIYIYLLGMSGPTLL